ncbi:Ubxn11 [Symbiodinium natans]|uniref:Ubxn11 protein n=1 Tax=Symbiodinium natans TaxID=878477 RepID=A0A812S936_9DINO|nr:Ubxn11 [Symbiodinium natans]
MTAPNSRPALPGRPGSRGEVSLEPELQHSLVAALLQDRPSETKEAQSPRRAGSRPPLPRLQAAGAAAVGRAEVAPRRKPSSDDSLVASLASRLAQVEQQNKCLKEELKERTQEVEELRSKLVRSSGDSGADGSGTSVGHSAEAECKHLRRQVEVMKGLLADYGLMWKPDAPSTDNAEVSPGGVTVDFQVIESRIEKLNATLNDTQKVVELGSAGYRACLRDNDQCLPLTFFNDGLKLAHHAFVPFEMSSAQEIIRNILDGCLPRVLREDYPEGVAMRAVNRTKHSFRTWLKEAAGDAELCDGGERLRPLGARMLHEESHSAPERFVAKLPERVLRNGHVCEVRSAIARRLGVGSSVRSSSAPTSPEVSLLQADRPSSAPAARLQVKLEGGQKVLLKMEFGDTVGDLWQALADWRSKNRVARARPGCVLRTAFPPKAYTDRSETLEAAGLTPSATLFVSCEASS